LTPQRSSVSGALRRYWWVALFVFCLVAAAGVAAAYVPTKRYEATATLLAQPATSTEFSSTSVALIQFLLPAIPEQVKSRGFREQLYSRLPFQLRAVEVTSSVEAGTGVVKVTANAKNPRAASVVANAAAERVVDERISPALNITILNRARTPTSPSSPRKKAILLAAAVLALLAGVGAALAAAGIRRPLPARLYETQELPMASEGGMTRQLDPGGTHAQGRLPR
jgi:capsular polysaccharide biosynthesis protein